MIKGLCGELKPLCQLDPLLLPLLVYICPHQELSKLFPLIPTYLSAAYLYESVNRGGIYYIQKFTTDEVSIIVLVTLHLS